MRFMLADWATKDYHNFRIRQESFTVVQSQGVYTAGTDFDITAGVGAGSFQRGLTAADFKSVSDESVEVLAPREPVQAQEPALAPLVSVLGRLAAG